MLGEATRSNSIFEGHYQVHFVVDLVRLEAGVELVLALALLPALIDGGRLCLQAGMKVLV